MKVFSSIKAKTIAWNFFFITKKKKSPLLELSLQLIGERGWVEL